MGKTEGRARHDLRVLAIAVLRKDSRLSVCWEVGDNRCDKSFGNVYIEEPMRYPGEIQRTTEYTGLGISKKYGLSSR